MCEIGYASIVRVHKHRQLVKNRYREFNWTEIKLSLLEKTTITAGVGKGGNGDAGRNLYFEWKIFCIIELNLYY